MSRAAGDGRTTAAFDGRLFRFLRPYRGALATATALTLASTALGLLSPWSLKILIDNVIGGDQLPRWLFFLDGFSPGRLALAVAGGGVGLVLVNVVLDYLATVLVGASEQRVAADMREAVFNRMHALSLEFHDRNRTGQLMVRATDDVCPFTASRRKGSEWFTVSGLVAIS